MTTQLEQTIQSIKPLDENAMQAARARQNELTKPPGSLGRLEVLSIQIAGITARPRPTLRRPAIITLAADHGVARQGVSAFPIEVTAQMVLNFLRGGAGINVLARHVGAEVIVADVGVAVDLPADDDLIVHKIDYGTRDLSTEPAMTREQARQSIQVGMAIAQNAIARGCDIVGTGEMGIGNTTPSSAIAAVFTGRPVRELTGRGSGVDDAGLTRKITVIEAALARHQPNPADGLDVLSKVGGFEIGGLAGVMLAAAAARVPVVVDGFISGAAALIAASLAPAVRDYMIAAHRSVEIGHRAILDHLGLHPVLDLDLRLGEGTGAALAISICQAACKVLDEMATFAEAGVSNKTS
ncbi:MAG: nicotinate-nucleotide--dimethylbenzimidazole phosphoribosyltransferase [Anaerolineae bacterium]|nr:nicotinate-nucleotide--dimethylbenzimidazole phosphoribosyltransferase [Thermoflexales bacterium]MDW8407904.1 nicotinate-nucleotide--dimethylbenzimidazole phosphoribosyltransferase [Anaerolineae bacterium]